MLNPERYAKARSVLAKLINNRVLPEGDDFDRSDRQVLLSEQYKTQTALEKLGVTPLEPPKRLPEINRIFMPSAEIEPAKPVAISIIGMPNAYKTTTISVKQQGREDILEPFYELGESWPTVKRMLQERL